MDTIFVGGVFQGHQWLLYELEVSCVLILINNTEKVNHGNTLLVFLYFMWFYLCFFFLYICMISIIRDENGE